MIFSITIQYERRNIRLKVERVTSTSEIEKFKVTASNGSFTLQTNRLLLRNKGLKYKKADWKVVVGAVNNRHIMESVINAIETYLQNNEKKPD